MDERIRIIPVMQSEFDHGGTRALGMDKSTAEFVLMMTQDAVPADEHLIENLLACMEDTSVAVAYARQLARPNSGRVERMTRIYNYPAQSRIKSEDDKKELGVKTYFCSDVCALYRKAYYEQVGGFVQPTIFNEDMIYAAKAVEAGYAIAYAADARVIHSHNYTNVQQFQRNFDLGVSQAEHPEVFAAYPSESEGKRMVKDVTVYLRSNHMSAGLPHFYMQCACKYAGYLLGKNYRRLPGKWVLAFTSNKEYWKQNRKDV